MDNVGDLGDAAGKGVLTGMTFGLAGSTVRDGYVFSTVFRKSGKDPFQKTYKHAIMSTVGNAKGPEGLSPMKANVAFGIVLRDLMLNLVKDLKLQGYL